jgi:ELP3 family radical SAM enzyme/protein acetyltransferase
MKKCTRSQSGVCVISIATDGFQNITCQFNCSFCPNECVENGAKKDIARSYLSSEGTFIRGLVDAFQPRNQIWRRIAELEGMNHFPDKFEIIVLGGTWDCMPQVYRTNLIHQIFYACNQYPNISNMLQGKFSQHLRDWYAKKPFLNHLPFDPDHTIESLLEPIRSLEEEKKINESLPHCRIIGIVLETRPDMISKFNSIHLRKLGCTRVQLGIQHTDNDILSKNNRGHGFEHSIKAIKILKDNCFKVDGHMMPDLPFTTLQKDYEMANIFFLSDQIQLDYIKIYPCLRLPYTQSEKWYEQGIWKPIAETNYSDFVSYLQYCLSIVPPWTRINRVQRDFPTATEKNEGLGFTSSTIKINLHQLITQDMEKKGMKCFDIRSREVKKDQIQESNACLYIREYYASEGTEFFISIEIPKNPSNNPDDAMLLGLIRLRLSNSDDLPYLMKCFYKQSVAKIRELHVYGFVSGNQSSNVIQHKGIGSFLLYVAETIAHSKKYEKIAVISGVGVRDYYRKRGYTTLTKHGEFLMKDLIQLPSSSTLFGKTYTSNSIVESLKQPIKHYKAAHGKLYIVKSSNIYRKYMWFMVCIMIVCMLLRMIV